MDASPLSHKMFIVFDPPEAVYAYHAAVHAAIAGAHTYARKHLTPPHITIKAPIVVSTVQTLEIRSILRELVGTGKVRRFAVELGEIGVFQKSAAIYLVVDGGAIRSQMFSIIDALAAAGYRRGFYEGLVPHITLAKTHKRQDIECVDGRPRGRYTIERLRIFTRHGIGSGEWDESEVVQLR